MCKKYYEINEETARRAWEMAHMSDYVDGSATAEYRKQVDHVFELAAKVEEIQPRNAEKAEKAAEKYAYKLADWYNRHNANGASCPSVLIAGPAKFPTRKKEKQISRDGALWAEWKEIQAIKNKISDYRHESAIQAGEEDAAERLNAKLAAAKECGNSAEAMRITNRINEIENAKNAGTNEIETPFFKIVKNAEIMRLQLVFDGIPSADERNILKSNGFKWAPSQKAWQRQLNANGERAAKAVIEKFSELHPETEKIDTKNIFLISAGGEEFKNGSRYDATRTIKSIIKGAKSTLKSRCFKVTGNYTIKEADKKIIVEITAGINAPEFDENGNTNPDLLSDLKQFESIFKLYQGRTSADSAPNFEIECKIAENYKNFEISYSFSGDSSDEKPVEAVAEPEQIPESEEQPEESAPAIDEAIPGQMTLEELPTVSEPESVTKSEFLTDEKAAEIIKNGVEIVEKESYIYNLCETRLNKMSSIEEYKQEIKEDGTIDIKKAHIARELRFTSVEAFRLFCCRLLDDYEFINGYGGTCTDDPRADKYNNIFEMPKELKYSLEWYNCNCISVYFENKLQFVIDPQGHSYCRYVFFTTAETITKAETPQPNPEQPTPEPTDETTTETEKPSENIFSFSGGGESPAPVQNLDRLQRDFIKSLAVGQRFTPDPNPPRNDTERKETGNLADSIAYAHAPALLGVGVGCEAVTPSPDANNKQSITAEKQSKNTTDTGQLCPYVETLPEILTAETFSNSPPVDSGGVYPDIKTATADNKNSIYKTVSGGLSCQSKQTKHIINIERSDPRKLYHNHYIIVVVSVLQHPPPCMSMLLP